MTNIEQTKRKSIIPFRKSKEILINKNTIEKNNLIVIGENIYESYKNVLIIGIERDIANCMKEKKSYQIFDVYINKIIEDICFQKYHLQKEDTETINNIIKNHIIDEFQKNKFYFTYLHINNRYNNDNNHLCLFWNKATYLYYKFFNLFKFIFKKHN